MRACAFAQSRKGSLLTIIKFEVYKDSDQIKFKTSTYVVF